MQNSKNVAQIEILCFAKLRKISPKFQFRVSRNVAKFEENFAKHEIKNFAKISRNCEKENFRSHPRWLSRWLTGCHGFGRGGCVVRIDGHGCDIDCGGCRDGYGPGGYGHRRWVGGRGGWSVVVMVVLVVVLKVMILLVGVMMFVACCVRDSVFLWSWWWSLWS